MNEESSASPVSIGPTVRRLAYLKTPDKIRVALINTIGSCPFPLVAIERELAKIEKARDKGVYTGKIGEPRASDANDFRVAGLVRKKEPPKGNREIVTPEEVRRIAREFKEKEEREQRAQREAQRLLKMAKIKAEEQRRIAIMPGLTVGQRLVKQVCAMLEIPEADFRSKSRFFEHVHARAVVAVLCRDRNTEESSLYSFPVIAKIIGRKDHSTVINLVDKWPTYCRINPNLFAVYKALGGSDRYAP